MREERRREVTFVVTRPDLSPRPEQAVSHDTRRSRTPERTYRKLYNLQGTCTSWKPSNFVDCPKPLGTVFSLFSWKIKVLDRELFFSLCPNSIYSVWLDRFSKSSQEMKSLPGSCQGSPVDEMCNVNSVLFTE